jgi:hypothetical protein
VDETGAILTNLADSIFPKPPNFGNDVLLQDGLRNGASRPGDLESCSTPTLQGDGASRPLVLSPLNIFSIAVTATLEAPQVPCMFERGAEAIRVRAHFA